ncbi:MAG: radical SAM protein [Spirochaetales bacterium]|nr:radical SAM protein [Spirochaetales bacterium]
MKKSTNHASGKVALIYCESKQHLQGCNPPYALLTLGTVLMNNEIDVKIFDLDAYNGSIEAMCKDIALFTPDISGIPVYHSAFHNIDIITKHFKEQKIGGLVILGGPEVSADPENVFSIFPDIQFGLMGEADESLLLFVRNYVNKKDLHHIPGLVYRDNNTLIKNPIEIIKDITSLPIPDRQLLIDNYEKKLYWRLGCKGTTDIIIASRGCPFNCSFCFKVTRIPRYRSAESIHKEIEQILSMGTKNIHFLDDLLVVNFKYVKEIFDPIDTKLGIKFKVRGRANSMNDEMVSYLAEKGVTEIVCGYESGSEKMLTLMNKRIKVQQNIDSIKTIKKYGVKAFADMLFMFPGENFDTAKESIDFIKTSKPTFVLWGFLAPFSGTPITQKLKAEGNLTGKYGINSEPTIKYDYLTGEEEKKLKDYIAGEMNRYNSNFFHVVLPNVINILMNSDFKRIKTILSKYRGIIFSKLFGNRVTRKKAKQKAS